MGATTLDGTPPPSSDEKSAKVMVGAIIILILVFLFVHLVHLYVRWLLSRGGGAEVHGLRRSRRRLVFAPTQEPLHTGLEACVVHALPLVTFKQEDFKEGLECAVCLCELEDGEKARLLPKCYHGFHLECIDMWFQSHSTCPLCRIPVGPDSDDCSPETLSEEADSGFEGVQSIEIPSNMLFWGNDSPASARTIGPEEVLATSPSLQSPCSCMYGTPNSSQDGRLVIDIPAKVMDGFSSLSPSASKSAEEDMKSPTNPMSARFRSLTRLLSREKKVMPSSPSSVDVEQGEGGRG